MKTHHSAVTFALASTVLLLTGCPTGSYDSKMQVHIDAGSVTAGGSTTGGGGGGTGGDVASDELRQLSASPEVNLSLPAILNDGQTLSLSGGGSSRAQPPFYNIPGFQLAMESFVESNGQQLPVYMYFGLESTAATPSDQLRTQVEQALSAKLTVNGSDSYSDGPNGEKINWRRLSATGKMEFDSSSTGGAKEELAGQFVLYMVKLQDHEAMIGWRAPSDVAVKQNFFNAVKSAMNTLSGSGFPQ